MTTKDLDSNLEGWIFAGNMDDIEREDVVRFDHADRTFAIIRSPEDVYYATDGLCTHERVHLADGLVMNHIIECPKHSGRFDYRTGQAKRRPACVDLRTYPVRIVGRRVLIELSTVAQEPDSDRISGEHCNG